MRRAESRSTLAKWKRGREAYCTRFESGRGVMTTTGSNPVVSAKPTGSPGSIPALSTTWAIRLVNLTCRRFGALVERLMAPDLKSDVPQGTGGSNPPGSAVGKRVVPCSASGKPKGNLPYATGR